VNSPTAPDQPEPPSAPSFEDAAITWLIERDEGLSPARQRELVRWLAADPRHSAALARLEHTSRLLGEIPSFRAELNLAFDRTALIVPFPSAPSPVLTVRRRRSRGLVWAGVAAALALAITLGWPSLRPREEARYATTVSSYERAVLDDGSTLELNAATAVRVQFTAAERRVRIDSGEAHFAVAHDTARPFVVNAGDVSVRAVGTAFNVRYAPDGVVEVTVTEGKVRIGRSGPGVPDIAPLVAAGERLVVSKHTPASTVEKIAPEILRASLAWQSPLANFDGTPLAAVLERFNARSHVKLVLDDPELGLRPIGGSFALDEAEAFVRLITLNGEIGAERRGEREILLRRAR
jgi:transmembrane sensor